MFRLFLIFTLALSFSCTEEISEELKNSDTSAALTDAQRFTGKKISLEHKMNDELSYRLHKQGSATIECSLASPITGFSAADYYKSLDDYPIGADEQVINCILEAQELDLWKNGADLELTVDEFLCEYVTYEPFKYYNFPAGKTTRVLYELSCEDDNCNPGCGNTYENINDSGPSATFSGLVDPQNVACYYDHTENNGPNCDTGTIRTVVYEMTGSVEEGDCSGTWEQTSSINEAACGGELEACIAGPAVDVLDDPLDQGIIYDNNELEKLVLDFNIPSPYSRIGQTENDNTNLYIANFSRICSNMTDLPDKNDATDYDGLDFQGKESEEIWRSNNYFAADSTNILYDNEGVIENFFSRHIGKFENLDSSVSSPHAIFSSGGAEYGSIGYTENPWRGIHRTSSYYSFRCLDKAYDTKAQVRLYIREWDRAYSDTVNPSSFALISDIYLDKIMDSDDQTNDGDDYNSLMDWDDFFANPNLNGNPLWLDNKCEETDTTLHFRRFGFPGSV
jgi:hypothetical protein